MLVTAIPLAVTFAVTITQLDDQSYFAASVRTILDESITALEAGELGHGDGHPAVHNLAWEVFDAARTYPWQERQSELATVRLDGEMLDLGTRQVRFRRRFMRVKQRPVAVPVRRRPQTDPDPRVPWV